METRELIAIVLLTAVNALPIALSLYFRRQRNREKAQASRSRVDLL